MKKGLIPKKGIIIIKVLDRKNEIDKEQIENTGVYFLHFSKDLEDQLQKCLVKEDIEHIFSRINEVS